MSALVKLHRGVDRCLPMLRDCSMAAIKETISQDTNVVALRTA